jgi:H+-transporting ATPase
MKPPPKVDPKDDLKTLPMSEVEKRLATTTEGLTGAEATKRLTQYGPNEITKKKTNPLLKFLSYFWGPIPWMIEAAVILSGVVDELFRLARSRELPDDLVRRLVRELDLLETRFTT